MKSHRRFSQVVFLSILAVIVMATAAMAAGRAGVFHAPATDQVAEQEASSTLDEGTGEECTPQDQGTSEGEGTSEDPGTSADCPPPPDQQDSENPQPDPSTPPPADREAECKAAAGISDSVGPPPDPATDTKATGLDHAIEVVLGNCIKNPQAPGLLNALRHLSENRDHHVARDAEQAARKAAHDEEKAARRAEHDAAKAAHEESHGKGHG
jgi:hypothetical protein